MGITPMEINNKEFKRSFRGYDIDDVDDFMESIVEDYEKLYKENSALRDKLGTVTEKLDHFTKIEATLQNTLVLAQGAADQAKSNSQKESELIIKNANETAQKMIDQAHTEVVRINAQYEKIKQEFSLFKSRYKSFIQTQLDLISDMDAVIVESKFPKDKVRSGKDDDKVGAQVDAGLSEAAVSSDDRESESKTGGDKLGGFLDSQIGLEGEDAQFKIKPINLNPDFDELDAENSGK